jgi:hypothetical protein
MTVVLAAALTHADLDIRIKHLAELGGADHMAS